MGQKVGLYYNYNSELKVLLTGKISRVDNTDFTYRVTLTPEAQEIAGCKSLFQNYCDLIPAREISKMSPVRK